MPIVKLWKCLALFFMSVVILTIILYLTGAVCLLLGMFNEYAFGCFLGVLHAILVWVAGYKAIHKIEISSKIYLIFTTLIPALLFHAGYAFLHHWHMTSSILDTNISEILYYFLFMRFAFSVATIAVALLALLRAFIRSRKRAGFRNEK